MQFNPSEHSDYGDGRAHSDAYSAQHMLSTYATGMNLGQIQYDEYGNALVGALIGAGTQITGSVVGAVAQGKQAKRDREYGAKTAKTQARIAEQQAVAAQAQAQAEGSKAAATMTTALYVAGAVTLLGAMGIGTWYLLKRD